MRAEPVLPVRLLALDIDGTLVGDDLTLGPRTRAAVGAAVERGLSVSLVTGRMASSAWRFASALGLRDPIVGRQEEGAVFTIPKVPVRRRLHGIETFNVLRGGEYFFMPSISALHWLANLQG